METKNQTSSTPSGNQLTNDLIRACLRGTLSDATSKNIPSSSSSPPEKGYPTESIRWMHRLSLSIDSLFRERLFSPKKIGRSVLESQGSAWPKDAPFVSLESRKKRLKMFVTYATTYIERLKQRAMGHHKHADQIRSQLKTLLESSSSCSPNADLSDHQMHVLHKYVALVVLERTCQLDQCVTEMLILFAHSQGSLFDRIESDIMSQLERIRLNDFSSYEKLTPVQWHNALGALFLQQHYDGFTDKEDLDILSSSSSPSPSSSSGEEKEAPNKSHSSAEFTSFCMHLNSFPTPFETPDQVIAFLGYVVCSCYATLRLWSKHTRAYKSSPMCVVLEQFLSNHDHPQQSSSPPPPWSLSTSPSPVAAVLSSRSSPMDSCDQQQDTDHKKSLTDPPSRPSPPLIVQKVTELLLTNHRDDTTDGDGGTFSLANRLESVPGYDEYFLSMMPTGHLNADDHDEVLALLPSQFSEIMKCVSNIPLEIFDQGLLHMHSDYPDIITRYGSWECYLRERENLSFCRVNTNHHENQLNDLIRKVFSGLSLKHDFSLILPVAPPHHHHHKSSHSIINTTTAIKKTERQVRGSSASCSQSSHDGGSSDDVDPPDGHTNGTTLEKENTQDDPPTHAITTDKPLHRKKSHTTTTKVTPSSAKKKSLPVTSAIRKKATTSKRTGDGNANTIIKGTSSSSSSSSRVSPGATTVEQRSSHSLGSSEHTTREHSVQLASSLALGNVERHLETLGSSLLLLVGQIEKQNNLIERIWTKNTDGGGGDTTQGASSSIPFCLVPSLPIPSSSSSSVIQLIASQQTDPSFVDTSPENKNTTTQGVPPQITGTKKRTTKKDNPQPKKRAIDGGNDLPVSGNGGQEEAVPPPPPPAKPKKVYQRRKPKVPTSQGPSENVSENLPLVDADPLTKTPPLPHGDAVPTPMELSDSQHDHQTAKLPPVDGVSATLDTVAAPQDHHLEGIPQQPPPIPDTTTITKKGTDEPKGRIPKKVAVTNMPPASVQHPQQKSTSKSHPLSTTLPNNNMTPLQSTHPVLPLDEFITHLSDPHFGSTSLASPPPPPPLSFNPYISPHMISPSPSLVKTEPYNSIGMGGGGGSVYQRKKRYGVKIIRR